MTLGECIPGDVIRCLCGGRATVERITQSFGRMYALCNCDRCGRWQRGAPTEVTVIEPVWREPAAAEDPLLTEAKRHESSAKTRRPHFRQP